MLTIISNVINILEQILENTEIEYEKRIISMLIEILRSVLKCYNCENSLRINIVSFLFKFSMELIFQLKYFKDKLSKKTVEEIMKELSRRSRRGASFSIRMLTDARDIPGKYKKDFLRIYLRICNNVHPSYSALLSKSGEDDIKMLFIDFLDVLLYMLILCYGRREDICEICRSLSLYHCSRRCR